MADNRRNSVVTILSSDTTDRTRHFAMFESGSTGAVRTWTERPLWPKAWHEMNPAPSVFVLPGYVAGVQSAVDAEFPK